MCFSSLQLNSLVAKQFATKLEVQNLSHKVCPPFSSWKVYKESLCLYSHIQKMGHMKWTN
jgi:hypothetical protein